MAAKNPTPVIHRNTKLAEIVQDKFGEAEEATNKINAIIKEAKDVPIRIPVEVLGAGAVQSESLKRILAGTWRVTPIKKNGSEEIEAYDLQ